MDSNIREWLALENIVTKEFNQKFLVPLLPNTKDECLKKGFVDCNNNCYNYFSISTGKKMCVTKTRIKRFEALEKSHIIVGKNGVSYRLMSTVKFDETIDNNVIYYYIFLSLSTNNIYILFNTGIVFTNDEFQNNKLKSFLQQLIDEILNEHLNPEQKIIICGHSMGCVLSLYTGMMIQKTNEEFFNSKIIIIGSAPFKYSNDSLFTFSYLPNVKIFVLCRIKDDKAIIDCFVDKGRGKYNYTPLTYFTANENGFLIDNINKYKKLFVHIESCDNWHSWEMYYDVLTKIYPFTSITERGGMRSRKSRRKRRRTIKKNRKTKSRK